MRGPDQTHAHAAQTLLLTHRTHEYTCSHTCGLSRMSHIRTWKACTHWHVLTYSALVLASACTHSCTLTLPCMLSDVYTLTWCATALPSATQARPFQGQGTWKAPTLLCRPCGCPTVEHKPRPAVPPRPPRKHLSPQELSPTGPPGPWAVPGRPGWLEMQGVLSCCAVGVAGGFRSPGARGLQQEAGEPHAATFTGHGDMLLLDKAGSIRAGRALSSGPGFLPAPEAACPPVSPTGGWAGRARSLGELGAGRPGILPGSVQGPRQWVRGQMAPVAQEGQTPQPRCHPIPRPSSASAPWGL